MDRIDFKKQGIPFTQIANAVLYQQDLSLGAKALYAYLYSKPDGWDFASQRIANELNVSKPTVLKLSQELEQFGYLKRYRLNTGRVLYHLFVEPQSKTLTMEPQSKKATVKKSHGEKSLPISNTVVISNTDSKSNTEIYGRFEDFWNVYPKKTGKKVCQSLWERKKLDRLADDIIAFIAKAKQTDRWQRGFIKNAETFLRQEAWTDDLVAYGATTNVSVYQEPTDLVAKLKAKNNLK